jgi:two-component system response regulator LytT
MRLRIREDASLDDISVDIACPRIDDRVRSIVTAANMVDRKLTGISKGTIRVIGLDEILYLETVDGKTFLYLADDVLESPLTLSQLEKDFAHTSLIRISRQMLVNLDHVKSIRPYINARLELVLDNEEHAIVSRQFAQGLKHAIGIS